MITKDRPLEGKSFLFVDDRLETTTNFIERLRADGAEVDHCVSIRGAVDALARNRYDLAVLDLHMRIPSPVPAELKEFLDELPANQGQVNVLNAGQVLGVFIAHRRGGDPPFIYLSAVAEEYVAIENAKPFKDTVLSKYLVSPRDFVATIAELVAQQPHAAG